MEAKYLKYILDFKQPSGTSRGVLTQKETWFIILRENGKIGVGECGLLRSLSIDDRPDYEAKLKWACDNIALGESALWESLIEFPSIQFGIETAFLSFRSENPFELFPSNFTNGTQNIAINGLIWMGDKVNMKAQIQQKITEGFSCVKLKIGAIDFDQELELLSFIRHNFTPDEIEIRVDANGAFGSNEASYKIGKLSEFKLHSIEQPMAKNQHDSMSLLCKSATLPIALDEELIGVFTLPEKQILLQKIKPQFIILKPSFIGGFRGTLEWISLAEKLGIGWWITSALESNIGLNAIAQFTFTLNTTMPQGLGTGALYNNNFESPLEVINGELHYNTEVKWNVGSITSIGSSSN